MIYLEREEDLRSGKVRYLEKEEFRKEWESPMIGEILEAATNTSKAQVDYIITNREPLISGLKKEYTGAKIGLKREFSPEDLDDAVFLTNSHLSNKALTLSDTLTERLRQYNEGSSDLAVEGLLFLIKATDMEEFQPRVNSMLGT